MTVITALTVAISLFVLGIFLLLVANTNNLARSLESELEIAAFLKVDLPREEAKVIGEKIKALPGVVAAELVPKEEGLNQLTQQLGRREDLLTALDGKNPLPDYYRIKAASPQEVSSLALRIQEIAGVEEVEYGQNVVQKLLQVTKWMRWLGGGLAVLLALAAAFLIALTIRLAVTARGKEIAIMKYVGATDWFIRWPFLLEGLILGLIGALGAAGMLYFGYGSLVSRLQASLAFLPLVTERAFIYTLMLTLVVAGAGVGAVGSAFSIRRFLRV